MVLQIDPKGRQTSITYDCLHNQTSRTLPNGATEYKEYDDLGRLIKSADFKGQVTGFEYDARGRLEFKKYYENETGYAANDPCETVQYIYDRLGRKREVIDGDRTTLYDYDIEGNIREVNSPEGAINYDYNGITGRMSSAYTGYTATNYAYDAQGRLQTVTLAKLRGSPVDYASGYEYTAAGNRWKMHLPNGITTTYSYDNCNRLLDINDTNSTGRVSQFSYELAADGMRQQLAENISTGGGRTVDYTYDNLNRVITESAAAASGSYDVEYTYDVVGNRTKRIISANEQCMQTDYVYNERDQLIKETHTDPGVCFWLNDKPVYAYTANGQITHYRMFGSSEDISQFKAYLLGIPTRWSNYIATAILGLLPISLLLISRRGHRVKYFLRQCLIITLAYLMLINPAWLQRETQAAIDYSNLGTANWGTVNRDIHYYYDENGSCVKKIEAVKDTADPETTFVNKTLYTYNLRNQLVKVEYTTDGTNWETTTYAYDDDGNRVGRNTTKYVVDTHNHTGYAQVLEERTGSGLPSYTYIIGDDVIARFLISVARYYLCDGQGSVRHHTDPSENLF